MVITAATPNIIPSAVKTERNLFARTASSAITNI